MCGINTKTPSKNTETHFVGYNKKEILMFANFTLLEIFKKNTYKYNWMIRFKLLPQEHRTNPWR